MLKTAVAIRHIGLEDLGAFEAPLVRAGYKVHYYDAGQDELWALDPVRTPLLIVLGGPMGVYEEDRFPFLTEELRLLEDRIAAGKPTLGICLGAQLIARACGARAYKGHAKEIGFAPVELTEAGRASCLAAIPDGQHVLHWHGDTFDLPAGAERLGSTRAYPNQAFAIGPNLLALQFHLEAGVRGFDRWLTGHAGELAAAGISPERLSRDAAAHGPALAEVADAVLTRWLGGLRE
jgi:GMP synthase (glutamine-hydrolysing)